eukprot:1196326-Prorocentrum_minimum.AAC.20
MDVPRLIEDDAELGHHINATSDRVMDNKVMTLEYDVVEMILSTAVCGAIYALTSGQPVALTGFGGAHLAFTGVLYSAATLMGVEFLPFFAWVGIWASLFLIVLTLTSASNLVLYFTRFTDETFSALSSVIFVYESTRNLVKPFLVSNPDKRLQTEGRLSLSVSGGGAQCSARVQQAHRLSMSARGQTRSSFAQSRSLHPLRWVAFWTLVVGAGRRICVPGHADGADDDGACADADTHQEERPLHQAHPQLAV